jgi:ribosomal protein L11 methyltransferase
MSKTLSRIEFTAPAADVPLVTVLLVEKLPYGWEEEEQATGAALFRLHVEDPAECEALIAELHAAFPDIAIARSEVPLRDWALAWREFFTMVLCGEDFVVLAPWMLDEQPYKTRIPIIIEPKTAFGTGHHATTALCLEAISNLKRAGRIAPGARFLDLGTGSGILGMGLAKLGLTGVGLDIDPLSIENSEENKTLNGVSDAFHIELGSIERVKGQQFEVVAANILAEPLITLAPEILEALAPGGCLILSGLLALQADGVAAAYQSLGLPEPRKMLREEWAALVWA